METSDGDIILKRDSVLSVKELLVMDEIEFKSHVIDDTFGVF